MLINNQGQYVPDESRQKQTHRAQWGGSKTRSPQGTPTGAPGAPSNVIYNAIKLLFLNKT